LAPLQKTPPRENQTVPAMSLKAGGAKGRGKGVSGVQFGAARPAAKLAMAGTAGKGGPKPPPGPRKRVVAGRVTGKVIKWRGPFGWIQPDVPINHEAAQKHGGKVYLDQVDVEQELSGVGAAVSFFVYTDGDGLGAERCIPSKGAPAQKTVVKAPAGKGKSKGVKKPTASLLAGEDGEKKSGGDPPDLASRETLIAEELTGVCTNWKGQVGWIRPDEPIELEEVKQFKKGKNSTFYVHATDVVGEEPLANAKVTFGLYKDTNGVGCENVLVVEQGDGIRRPKEGAAVTQSVATNGVKTKFNKAKAQKGKGKGQRERDNGPSGPDLPRSRITDTPITGEVVAWSRRIGWIKALEPVEHPDAEKRGGKIYCHVQDLVGAEKLEKGGTVQFHLFQDESGLGAEEVTPL